MIFLIETFILIGLLHFVYAAGFSWEIMNKALSLIVMIMIVVVAPMPMRVLMAIYFVIFLITKTPLAENVKNV